jgi:hypothetical protein
MGSKIRRRKRRHGFRGPSRVFSQEEYLKTLDEKPNIRYRGQIVARVPEQAKVVIKNPNEIHGEPHLPRAQCRSACESGVLSPGS